MILYTTLKEIEKEYQEKVGYALNNGHSLTAELLLELSVALFSEFKITGISDSEYKEADMLLFQYGTYNWGNEFGNHFSLDITRQFIDPEQDEPYQLSFTLIYEPEQFKDIDSYNYWSDACADINSFATNIKTTNGFKAAAKKIPKSYQIRFGQC